MSQKIVQVDAFTQKPFAGNPAAVCVLHDPAPESWMQNVASEMNLSETAFLVKRDDGYDLRWFTPTVEVDLCGHATLASAHTLWESGLLLPQEEARFHTKSGLLTARQHNDRIEMDFPATPAKAVEAPPALLDAVGVEPTFVGRNDVDFLLEVASEDILRNLTPDFGALKRASERGVIVTCASSTAQFDFVSRFFAPAAGIDEDPVTRSAHCTLGPYWSNRQGKTQMTAFQASARGGTVYLRLEGDRVILGGHAVTVMRAELADI